MQSLGTSPSSDTASKRSPRCRYGAFSKVDSLDSPGVDITQDLTSFAFSPFGSTAARLSILGFDSGKKV